MPQPSRRSVLKSSALAAGSLLLPRNTLSASPSADRGATQFDQFSYADVELLPGPLLDQFQHNHTLFLNLSDDALLKPFRQAAGQPAPGDDMGGWYSPSKDFDPPRNLTGYIPGHTFGQYLSGLSRAFAATGDQATQAKIHRLVSGYAQTISPSFWQNYCLPAYTSDKTTCGLIDAHQFAGDPRALAVLAHATDAVLPFLPPKALTRPEMEARPHPNIAWTWDESYTLPENLFLAYRRSGDQRYRDLAVRFLQDDTYFNPLADGQNVLPGQHAYSHVNALCSALQAYLVLGSEKHLRAARNGFGFVLSGQSFATGGWGPNETFRDPASDDLATSLSTTHASFETPCGAYGHFKVSRYLLRITGQSTFGDTMESVLYNTVLGARPTEPDGRTFYYADYNTDASKSFHQDRWPCCSGTFAQLSADYGISTYLRSPDTVVVNLFVPSRVHWQQGGARFSLEQRTAYPLSPVTTLRVSAARRATFTVALRVPAWAGHHTAVRVNGKPFPSPLEPGTFAALTREWSDGDTVEYLLDMPTRLVPISPRHPDLVALMHGPLTLFAVDPGPATFTRAGLLAAAQAREGSSDWTATGSGGNGSTTFRPFFAIDREHYRLYHQVSA